MSIASYLPKKFALRSSDGFKLFASCIFRNSSERDISILSRIDSCKLLNVALINSSKTIYSSVTRKWYGGDSVLVNWAYEGSELQISTGNYIPIILFIKCSHGILPSGGDVYFPETVEVEHKSMTTYEPPDIYYSEPYLSSTVSSSIVAGSNKTLPHHVKLILIEHSIRGNESCAISGEDLTAEMATVTSCGHVFDRTSICRWLSSTDSKSLCPICKQVCVV